MFRCARRDSAPPRVVARVARSRRPATDPRGPFSRLSRGRLFPGSVHRKAPMRARTERRRRTRAARPRARRDTCGRDLRDVRFRARVCARRRSVSRKAEPNLPHLAGAFYHTDTLQTGVCKSLVVAGVLKPTPSGDVCITQRQFQHCTFSHIRDDEKNHIKTNVTLAPLFLSHDPPISPRPPTVV